MTELLPIKTPDFLLVADRPLASGGRPEKITKEAIKEKLGFEYSENFHVHNNPPNKVMKPDTHRISWDKIKDRLENPLNHQLVVCFINREVGHGVFTQKFIKAGTIIGVYAGNIEETSEADDYGMRIYDTNFVINAHQLGGITRFIQHMPPSYPLSQAFIDSANKEVFLAIAENHGIYFQPNEKTAFNNKAVLNKAKSDYSSRLTTLEPEEEDILENEPLKKIPNLATANVRPIVTIYKEKPIIYFQAISDIQPKEQLGINYGSPYWLHRGIIPHYFDKNGVVIPRDKYIDINEIAKPIPMGEKLHFAAFLGDVYATIVLLFYCNFNINNQTGDRNGAQRTPLLAAITGLVFAKRQREHTQKIEEVVRLLIKRNADLEIADAKGNTALHYAVQNNLIDIIILMLGRGVAVNSLDQRGKKPFDYNVELAQEIFKDSFKEHASDLLTSYHFSKVLTNEVKYWDEEEIGSLAGFYIDNLSKNNFFLVFFGEKQNKNAISIVNYSQNTPTKNIQEAYSWFDKSPICFLCLPAKEINVEQRMFNHFLHKLDKSQISVQQVHIEASCDIMVIHYLLKENTISPRIGFLRHDCIKDFYGELIDYETVLNKKAEIKSPSNLLGQSSFIANMGSNESIKQLNSITYEICNQSWNTRGQTFSLKAASNNLAQTIYDYLFLHGIKEMKINGGKRIIINSLNACVLAKIPLMRKAAEEQQALLKI